MTFYESLLVKLVDVDKEAIGDKKVCEL